MISLDNRLEDVLIDSEMWYRDYDGPEWEFHIPGEGFETYEYNQIPYMVTYIKSLEAVARATKLRMPSVPHFYDSNFEDRWEKFITQLNDWRRKQLEALDAAPRWVLLDTSDERE